MKLFFTTLISIVYLVSYSQRKPDLKLFDTILNVPKGSNIVYAKNSDFKAVCNAILDRGFEIEKKDNDLLTVETYQKGYWTPKISVRIKDSITIIKTIVSMPEGYILESGYYKQRKNGKPKEDVFVYAFLEANKIASMISKEITYSKE